MSATKRKRESEPNLVDNYSELCDELKAKYKMNEGEWKALLDLGMALYKRSPDADKTDADANVLRLIDQIREEMQNQRAALARADAEQAAAVAEAHAAVDAHLAVKRDCEHVTLRTCKDGILNDDFGTKDYWLVQQENCARCNPHGLSLAIRKKYSYGCVLHLPPSERKPGQVLIRQPPDGLDYGAEAWSQGPIVVNLLAQRFPGKPGGLTDNARFREGYFRRCLGALRESVDAEVAKRKGSQGGFQSQLNVVFPDKIGCGLAGGDWKIYRKMITDWAATLEGKVFVWIVKMAE